MKYSVSDGTANRINKRAVMDSSLLLTIVTALIFSISSSPVSAQGFGGEMTNVTEFLKYLPPIIRTVRHAPVNPQENDEVVVTADVGRINFVEDFEYIDSVTLYYSKDFAETFVEVGMDQGDNERFWTGTIPPCDDGTEVIYYIKAVDTVGNVAMVMPPINSMTSEWYSMDDEAFETAVPQDYTFKMFDHEDKPDNEVPSDLDVLSASFGYDDDSYYFRYTFDSKPLPGTMSPIDANVYVFLMINRALMFSPEIMNAATLYKDTGKTDMSFLDKNRGEIVDFFSSMWLWFYAPVADIAPPLPDIGKLPSITLAHLDPEASGCPIKSGASLSSLDSRAFSCIVFEKEGWEYSIKGKNMNITLDRNMIGTAKNDTINFVMLNLRIVGSDIMNIQVKPGDVSYSTGIVMKHKGYIVGEENAENSKEEQESEYDQSDFDELYDDEQ